MDKQKPAENSEIQEMLDDAKLNGLIDEELTDEQLLQMAEGSCSWGANCNRGC